MKNTIFPGREQPYIICVDDEQAILNQLSAQLEDAFGDLCIIEYAESAEEALVLMDEIEARGGTILLVVSDQVMPGMQGDRFLEQVNVRFPQAHKVLLTGYAGIESAMYAINYAGLDKYIEKPWDRAEFLLTVQTLIGSTVETTVSDDTFRIREAIQNVVMFRDLAVHEIDLIAEKLQLSTFDKDAVIFNIDDPADCMYIIKTGEVKVVAGVDDSGEVLAYLGRGNYFGEMALLSGEARSATVITTIDTELFQLTKTDFDLILAKHPAIAVTLSHVLSQRLRDLSIKRAGRQNKIICVLNPLASADKTMIVQDLAQKLRKETNRKVALIDLSGISAFHPTAGVSERKTTTVRWILENLDTIREDELIRLLPEDEVGVKYFLPPLNEEIEVFASLIPLFSMFKEFYNFVFVYLCADDALTNELVRVLEQVTTGLYLLEQTDHFSAADVPLLLALKQEQPHLLKKIEIAVIQDAPNQQVLEVLASLVERYRIHYLRRDGERVNFLFQHAHPIELPLLRAGVPVAHRDVSRIARRLGNVSIGLVLGGGGARAYAHLGVLKVLQEEGIPIDIIAGTSMGAFLGALFIMGKSIEEILTISRESWRRLNSPLSWTLPRIAFIKGRRIRNLVHEIFGDILIEDLPLPFSCVAADLVTGQEVVIASGPLYQAILATGALPGFFEPVTRREMYLVDGGVVNNVPGDVLKKQGIDIVIAVDVTPEREVRLIPGGDRQHEPSGETSLWRRIGERLAFLKARYGTILLPRIIMRVIAIEGLEITRTKARYFDIHIKPNLENFDLFDFKQLRQIVDIGEQAGRQEITKIRETLNSLKR